MNYSANKKEIPVVLNNKKQNSDNECNNLTVSVLARQYSGFVFLISMKYLKDEEKSKDTVLQIFKRLNKPVQKIDVSNIKAWLYHETKNYCLTNSN